MKGTVLTGSRQPIRVVQVTSDDGQRQIAIVGFPPGSDDGALIGATPLYQIGNDMKDQIRETARAALREQEAHFLRVMGGRLQQTVVAASSITLSGTGAATELILSPGGRKVSFSFRHQALGEEMQEYEVIIRRKRS